MAVADVNAKFVELKAEIKVKEKAHSVILNGSSLYINQYYCGAAEYCGVLRSYNYLST